MTEHVGRRRFHTLWRLPLASRLIAVGASMLVTGYVLFIDGFPPHSWRTWLGLAESPHAAAITKHGHQGPPMLVTPPRPLGTDSSVSKVPLPLILVGTQPGRNSREGFAFIGVNEATPQTYVAGALLANGARLTEIYPRCVLLERDGRAARLCKQGDPQPSTSTELTSLVTVGGIPAPAPAVAISHDPLTDVMRPSPVYKDNALKGLRVYSGTNTEAFVQLGLNDGDVIEAIDGQRIADPTAALDSLRSLMSGVALIVQVNRDGHPRTLSLDGATVLSTIEKQKAAVTHSNGKQETT